MKQKVVIFDTEAEAETQAAIDFIFWMTNHSGEDYAAGTTKYATPKLRLDGKWDYRCCPHQDYTGMLVRPWSRKDYLESEDPLNMIKKPKKNLPRGE